MKPRAIIAEDEPLLAESLRAALQAAWPDLEIVYTAANGLHALDALKKLKPDIAFLDIKMPGMTGLEVAAELVDALGPQEHPPAIVFVTAYDEFALKAFDLAALDYVLKPINAERLARTVARLRERISPSSADALAAQLRQLLPSEPRRAPIRVIRAGSGPAIRLIPIEEVCYFQAADKYTRVVTRKDEALIRTPLKELLAQLPAERFTQVHRNTIVNMDEVAQATRDDLGKITLRLRHREESLAVSRIYADLFKAM